MRVRKEETTMTNRSANQLAVYFSVAICAVCFLFCDCAQSTPLSNASPDSGFVLVKGAHLWYEIEGKGEPLLLIPGGPGASHGYFHPCFSALADSYRVIYFDAFGRGKSDRAESPSAYTFERDVEDIEGIRKELNLGQINVFGHSYGGMVAQAYALKYPASVKRLILANTLFSGEMWQANNDNCNNEIRNQYPEVWERIQTLRAQGFHSNAKEHQEAYSEIPLGLFYFYDASKAANVPVEINPDVYYSIAGDDADFLIGGDVAKLDFRMQLKNLRMPTLILASRFDRVSLPRFSTQFRQYAPQAEFVMFEKAGHFPFIEDPNEMFRVLREFLSK
jgi:proline iminopeptidase